jgi:hypothetical protein
VLKVGSNKVITPLIGRIEDRHAPFLALRLSSLLDLVGQEYRGLLYLRRKVCCRI